MAETRRIEARIGITLLSVLAPGLGLLRLGRWRAAIAFYGAILIVSLFLTFGPPAPFFIYALVVVAIIAGYLAAIILTWRLTRSQTTDKPWHTRWYSIIGALSIVWLISFFQTDDDLRRYRNFYMPAESMAPTLFKNDRFIAHMRSGKLRRGDLVLVPNHRGDIYLKRIAGLPGDRIAMEDGQVVLNGANLAQRLIRSEQIKEVPGPVAARRLEERFPGEARPHEIYDYGASPGDEMPEQIVRPGYVFLLGDNRDRSADSRFSHEDFGLEQVPIASLAGRPLYFSWGSSRPIGTRLSRD